MAPGVVLTPSDWFLLSRLDGQTEVHLLGQMTGMTDVDALDCVRRLIAAGLATAPGLVMAGAHQPPAHRPETSPRTPVLNPPRTETSPRVAVVSPPRTEPLPRAGFGSASPAGTAPRAGSVPNPRPDSSPRQPVAPGSPRSASLGASQDWPHSSPSNPNVHTAPTRPMASVGAPDPARQSANEKSSAGKPSAASGFAPDLVQRNWTIPFDKFVCDPEDLREGPELDVDQKQVVLYFHHHLRRVTYYQLFKVEPAADPATIRNAYFTLSKAFHPDRWFRRDIGSFASRIEDIFKWVNRANGVLSNAQKRKGYDNLLRQGYIGEWQLEEKASRPSTAGAPIPERQKAPVATASEAQKRAASVFRARAIQAESLAQWSSAIDQYQRALQLDDTSELRIALIECMLRAQRPTTEITAELERARQAAPGDVRLMLLDAEHARRQGAIARATRLYNEVLKVDASNPVARMGLERLSGSN